MVKKTKLYEENMKKYKEPSEFERALLSWVVRNLACEHTKLNEDGSCWMCGNTFRIKRFIKRCLGWMSIIDYCPRHDCKYTFYGYNEEKSYCKKCKEEGD
jgi:hypothetical protein